MERYTAYFDADGKFVDLCKESTGQHFTRKDAEPWAEFEAWNRRQRSPISVEDREPPPSPLKTIRELRAKDPARWTDQEMRDGLCAILELFP